MAPYKKEIMKRKKMFWTIVLLGGIGYVGFFFLQVRPQPQRRISPNTKSTLETSVGDRTTPAPRLISKFDIDPSKPYNGPQTVDALLEAFSWVAADPVVDEKYPQKEWLQMLLDRGIVIGNYYDYSGYMAARRALVQLENQPNMWTSDVFGLPPTNDWETFKSAFIEKHIWEYEQYRAARQADPEVTSGFFVGPDKRILLPGKPGRVYVKREKRGAIFIGASLDDAQKEALLYGGIHPEGFEIIYIDENGNRLAEVPQPIIPDDISGMPMPFTEEGRLDARNTENTTQKPEEKPAAMQQNGIHDSAPLTDAEFEKFLEQLSTEELAEFEEFLTEEFSQIVPEQGRFKEPIETEFRERFSLERFNRAMQILNRYGPQEGIRKLFDEDAELAEQFEKHLYRRGTSRNGGTK